MDPRQRLYRTDTVTRVGLVLLILAIGSRWFVHPSAIMPAGSSMERQDSSMACRSGAC